MEAFGVFLVFAYFFFYVMFCGMKIARRLGYQMKFGALLPFPVLQLIPLTYVAFETLPILRVPRAKRIAQLETELGRLESVKQEIAQLKAEEELVKLKADEELAKFKAEEEGKK